MWRDEAFLLDILIAAKRTRKFISGLEWENFQKDELRSDAIMRNLEIIGEAANKISPEFKNAHPEIPWNDMVGMRNRLIHDYFRVDFVKVWDTVQKDIPALIALVEPHVPSEEDV
ncbi:MAG: DUF86 domain-containing protein [Actinobacteria bacterium]|nr:DUF86 domain-containing protein [Actinomycetota bacterium]